MTKMKFRPKNGGETVLVRMLKMSGWGRNAKHHFSPKATIEIMRRNGFVPAGKRQR